MRLPPQGRLLAIMAPRQCQAHQQHAGGKPGGRAIQSRNLAQFAWRQRKSRAAASAATAGSPRPRTPTKTRARPVGQDGRRAAAFPALGHVRSCRREAGTTARSGISRDARLLPTSVVSNAQAAATQQSTYRPCTSAALNRNVVSNHITMRKLTGTGARGEKQQPMPSVPHAEHRHGIQSLGAMRLKSPSGPCPKALQLTAPCALNQSSHFK